MYACIYVPDFTVQTILRSEPALRDQALAIVDGGAPLLRVIALNENGRREGVQRGMTQAQAAEFASVQIRRRSPAQEAAAHAALLDCASAFSPRVEATARDTIVLDLAGLDRLFRSAEAVYKPPLHFPADEIAQRISEHVSEAGLEANVGVAANPDAAVHVARGFLGITVIPSGKEAERLGDLPVQVLAPPVEILETLQRWGVRTFRELAALPTLPLSERLGQEGVRLQELARGESLRAIVCAEEKLKFEEVMELEYPVELLEPLLFILGRLLDQLCARLASRAVAANEICLCLELEGKSSVVSDQRSVEEKQQTSDYGVQTTYAKTLRLPVPMQDSRVFLKLLQLHLQAQPPPAPVTKVFIAAEPARPRSAQHGLFLPPAPDPQKLEVLLARLAGVVGEGRAGSPELLDTHRPGAFRMRQFNPEDDRGGSRTALPRNGSPIPTDALMPTSAMAFRVFRPPLLAIVELQGGRPTRVLAGRVAGRIVHASGPWRTSGDWWRDDAWAHDEWDVEISVISGQSSVVGYRQQITNDRPQTCLYCIYRDLATGDWFVEGSYD